MSASAAGNLGKVVFQYLIILCAEVERNCPTVWPSVSERLFWPVEDPTALEGSEEGGLVKFRVVRDRIEQLVKAWWSVGPSGLRLVSRPGPLVPRSWPTKKGSQRTGWPPPTSVYDVLIVCVLDRAKS